jgi:ERF superfamily protein
MANGQLALNPDVIPVPDEQPSLLAVIIQATKDPSIDVQKLNALFDFKLRIEQRDAEIAFNQALADLLPRLPRIVKDKEIKLGAGKGTIPFASYEQVMRIVGPLLHNAGFTESFTSEDTDSGVLMTLTVRHRAGHAVTSKLRLPPDAGPGRNNNQAIGSARSYAKRYLICDFLNIVFVGEDMDGAGVTQCITHEQINQILDMLLHCGLGGPKAKPFLEFMGVQKVEEIVREDYPKAMEALKKKRGQPK